MPLFNPITAASITDATAAGRGLITTLSTPGSDSVVLISSANAAVVIAGATSVGPVSPVVSAQSDRGVVIGLT